RQPSPARASITSIPKRISRASTPALSLPRLVTPSSPAQPGIISAISASCLPPAKTRARSFFLVRAQSHREHFRRLLAYIYHWEIPCVVHDMSYTTYTRQSMTYSNLFHSIDSIRNVTGYLWLVLVAVWLVSALTVKQTVVKQSSGARIWYLLILALG